MSPCMSEDLNDKEIVVLRGYVYGTAFEEAKKKGLFKKIYKLEKEADAVKFIIQGRADATAFPPLVARNVLKKLKPEDREKIVFHPKSLSRDSWSPLFSKGERGKKFMELYNKGLEKLKKKFGAQWVLQPCDKDPNKVPNNLPKEVKDMIVKLCK